MSAVEGSLGFLPRRDHGRLRTATSARDGCSATPGSRANCAMGDAASEANQPRRDPRRAVAPAPAPRRPPRRRRRDPARSGGGRAGAPPRRRRRRGRRGRPRAPPAVAEAHRRPCRDRRPRSPPWRAKTPRSTACEARAHVIVADALSAPDRRAAGLADGGRPRRDQSAVFRRSKRSRLARCAWRATRARGRRQDARRRRRGASKAWIVACLALLAPGGRFIMIHRPDALGANPRRVRTPARRRRDCCRSIRAPDAPAHRLLICGVKGARAPTQHRAAAWRSTTNGAPPPHAQAIHRGEATIDWARRRADAGRPKLRRRVDPGGRPLLGSAPAFELQSSRRHAPPLRSQFRRRRRSPRSRKIVPRR